MNTTTADLDQQYAAQALAGTHGSFKQMLYLLFPHADANNLRLLRLVFHDDVRRWEAWMRG